MSQDKDSKAKKTDESAKPMTEEEAKKAVGGAMPPYSASRPETGEDDTVGFRRYRR